ncbi:MAG: beta-lactamase family protein [Alphaproteobacteria bacterium]|nr:beta-lactamase family protein [Alphaproteobacteria bacterium]MBU1512495.1 beta-lactamase family protein [Alphaproteobacteria bacterium]MBU2096581.1 beta-lactamase family protein [Alphaproteobacteria bacterium]MBU2151601.1 beta-lactamase family protein [Alphaproteobacteria bacterium]MBU2307319.1 beta-lactamase family protein [Alphaproteobacteria bacterium]
MAQAPANFLDAKASDPIAMGWMIGSPPPPERTIRFEDSSFLQFPQIRWTFSHWRELFPTVGVSRGAGPVSRLPVAQRTDLDGVTFTTLGANQPMTWGQSVAANYTDGIVVMHKGAIVYERYFGALKPEGMHIAHSATKSFVGTIAATLVAEGKLDRDAKVSRYLPELKDSAFGDATVGQVLDMTTGLEYTENYADPNSDAWNFVRAASLLPRPAGYSGPTTSYDYLKTVKKAGEHGQAFAYKSVNTEVVGWLVSRVTGQHLEQVLSERLWQPLGMEQDGYMQVDSNGAAYAAGGLNLQLRDFARFCEMMRLGGRFNGRQIVPAAVVADIARGASKANFAKAGYATLPGWSYHNQWWVSHNDNGAFMARGVHGQACYVDPKAEMSIVRFASFPLAANGNLDPTSLPAYDALAKHLMAHPR